MEKEILNLLNNGNKTWDEISSHFQTTTLEQKRNLTNTLIKLVKESKIFYNKKANFYGTKKQVYYGIFCETKNDYGFINLDDGTSYFVPPRLTLNAFDGDSVKFILIDSKKREGEKVAKILRVVQRNGNNLLGKVHKQNEEWLFHFIDKFSKNKFVIDNPDFLTNGDVVVCKFLSIDEHNVVRLKLKTVLGKEKNPLIDLDYVINLYNLNQNFSEEILSYVQKVNYDKEIYSNRQDYTNDLVITIDGNDSKDLDDAISLEETNEGFNLYVHIADVTNYVEESSIIDEEALARGNSTYFIDCVIPMLPKKLSNDICSLNPQTKKKTITAKFSLDKNHNITNFNLMPSIIESKYRLTYDEVDELLKSDFSFDLRDDAKLTKMIKNLYSLSHLLREQKIKKGMIDFDMPELIVDLDEYNKPKQTYYKYQSDAQKLIENLMVLTNAYVANKLIEKKVPSVFRIHEKLQPENLSKFIYLSNKVNIRFTKPLNEVTNLDITQMLINIKTLDNEYIKLKLKKALIQSMEKAKYGVENVGHYALGIEEYLHFTSPIRRYSDLLVHRSISKIIFKNNKQKLIIDDEMINHINETEKNSSFAEWKYKDIKKTRMFEDQEETKHISKVDTITNSGIFVEINEIQQGFIKMETLLKEEYYKFQINEDKTTLVIINTKTDNEVLKISIGDDIEVTIDRINILKGCLDVILNHNYEGISEE